VSRLREKLEEGKGFTPSVEIVDQVYSIVFRAADNAYEVAEDLRKLRKVAKAYRGKELKKLEDQTHKLVFVLDGLKATIKQDKVLAKEKFEKHVDAVLARDRRK